MRAEQSVTTSGQRGITERFSAVTWSKVSFRQFALTAKIRSGARGRRKLYWLNTFFDLNLEMHF